MPRPDFQAFDADNHYYEAEDAFTRHIDPSMAKRCMQWADINGKQRLLVGGRVNKFIPNPTFDPIARPGSLEDYFRGRNTEGRDLATMFGDLESLADNPGYRDRDARLALMDSQGLERAFLFPTLGVGMQVALRHDLPALHAAFRAFNLWLDEDWGFDRDGRLFAAPMLSLADPIEAAAEVDRVLAAGARLVVMVPGPVPTSDGYQSPGMTDYDPVWARLEDADTLVAFHAGLSGTSQYVKVWESGPAQFEAFRHSAFPLVAFTDRTISDTFAALICHGVFCRFPGLRIVSIENGGMWVPELLRHLASAHGKMPFAFERHPVEQFQANVWVSPYFEDDMVMLRDLLGIDRLLFGSDYPHAEGLADPMSYVDELEGFDDDEIRKFMRDNADGLIGTG